MASGRRRVKCTKERCLKCKYVMNMTGASMVKRGDSGALIACGYILKTGESRVFKDGHVKENYQPGYCNYYCPGERLVSMNTTIKKGQPKND